MRFLNRLVTKRHLAKFIFVLTFIVVLSKYCFRLRYVEEEEERRERQIQEIARRDVHADSSKHSRTDGGHEVSSEASVTNPRRDAERLVEEFIIGRKLRGPPGGLNFAKGHETVMYNRHNTPGYFKRRNWHWTLTDVGKYSSDVYGVPPEEVPEQRLPKVFLLGVSYCGSITLSEYLKMHPYLITVSPEVRYFDLEESLIKGLDWYKSQMPLSFMNQVTVEVANPSYFWDHRAPRKIYKMNKGTKFIIVFRDPVERIMSLAASMGTEKAREDLTSVVNGMDKVNAKSATVSSGIYVKYMRQWLGYFPLSQFHVLDYKDLSTRPASVFDDLENFLDIPHKISARNFFFNTTDHHYCARPFHTQTVVCPRTEQSTVRLLPYEESLLHYFFRSYNEELFTVLGRRFDWSNFPRDNKIEVNGQIGVQVEK